MSTQEANVNWSFQEIRDPNCQRCELYLKARTVCLTGQGPKSAVAAIFGEAPGLREDSPDVRRPFSGKAGKLLDELLKEVGLDREQLYVSNVAKCFPGDIDPTLEHARACDVYTQKELAEVKPKYALLLGDLAAQHLAGLGKITKNRGRIVKRNGTSYLLSIHPAYVLRNPSARPLLLQDLKTFARMIGGPAYLVPPSVQVADSPPRVEEMLRSLEKSPFIAYDLETEGLKSWVPGKRIWCISFSDGNQTWVVPLEHPQSLLYQNRQVDMALSLLKPFLEQPGRRKVTQGGQFDSRWLASRSIEVTNSFDTMLAAYLLDENTSIGLKSLASRFFGVPDYSLEVESWDRKVPEFPEMIWYSGCDAFYTAQLYPILRQEIVKDRGLTHCLAWLMMPTSKLLSRIEERGVYFDANRYEESRNKALARAAEIEESMNSYLDGSGPINWNSPQQLGQLLYDRLKLPEIEKTAGGQRSTREGVLKKLADKHPLVKDLMEYRGLKKNLSNWLSRWQEAAASDGRIHSHYKHTGTITGRLSCEDENLHQVPRDPSIRSILGARPGWLFVEADLSQIELRIAAWMADEPTMKREFQEGIDPHTRTAVQITGLPEESIDKETRKKAKAVNFGFLFVMGWKKFREYAYEKYDVEVSEQEAKEYQKQFFTHWPKLAQWHDQMRHTVHKQGYIRLPDGRIRHLPQANSSDRGISAEAERQSINSGVQGFASDLTLMAAVELEGLLAGIVENPRALDPTEAEIVGQVHDALVFEVEPNAVDRVCQRIEEVMTHPSLLDKMNISIDVPLEVEIRIGTRWADPESTIWRKKKERVQQLTR